jgi:hypothetical protein
MLSLLADGRFIMRSAILILLASMAFATTARAQSAWLERDMVSAVCSREAAPAASERLAGRLNLGLKPRNWQRRDKS